MGFNDGCRVEVRPNVGRSEGVNPVVGAICNAGVSDAVGRSDGISPRAGFSDSPALRDCSVGRPDESKRCCCC